MPEKPQGGPAPRGVTIRAAIVEALAAAPLSAREISAAVGIAERDVAEHLEHLEHSLPHHGQRLTVEPPTCIGCGFSFESRTRRSRPGRCPRCRSERIDPARFGLEAARGSRRGAP